jgi:glutamine amidotransferase/cyclase
MVLVSVLDYGAGNVRSLLNALAAVGGEVHLVTSAEEIGAAEVLIFPGVGSFGACMDVLRAKGWIDALRAYCRADRPFLGICLGLQTLFESSDESPGVEGLGVLPANVGLFAGEGGRSVPQIGWNTLRAEKPSALLAGLQPDDAVYFVHSFRAAVCEALAPWALTTTDYGERYVSAVQRGNVAACQFHPEKSGRVGLAVLRNFLAGALSTTPATAPTPPADAARPTRYCKRVIAALDVRANDAGDLVVTKGDQYDVREKPAEEAAGAKGSVRNLGKPVALAKRYYEEGADEIALLNITGFRDLPLTDLPMLALIEEASKEIFVPLTVGGGIRGFTDSAGVTSTALQVITN